MDGAHGALIEDGIGPPDALNEQCLRRRRAGHLGHGDEDDGVILTLVSFNIGHYVFNSVIAHSAASISAAPCADVSLP